MTMRWLKGLFAMVGILGLLTAVVAPAEAVVFTFTHKGGFTITTQTHTNEDGGIEFFSSTGFAATGVNSPNLTYREIGWGCNAGDGNPCAVDGSVVLVAPSTKSTPTTEDRSAMQIMALSGSAADTAAPDWVDITVLWHYNRAIPSRSSTLTGIDIDTLLTINAVPAVPDAGLATITFTETFNFADIGDCPNPTPAGTNCDDFFEFDDGVFAAINFTHGGVDYEALFRLIIPTDLTDCAGVTTDLLTDCTPGNGNGASFFNNDGRVYTGEGLVSEGRVQMLIREVAVPNPTALLLLGLGLGALGLRRRFGLK